MPALKPGQIVGKYRIIRVLGAGGMGAVYEAENPEIGQRTALKVLTVDTLSLPGLFQRFVNEARAANQVKHPSVVKVHDFGQFEGGVPWMAMEYLEGESLADRLTAAAGLPGSCLGMDALWMVVELASALGAAHAQGIVHRDLKPGNVMLVPDPLSQHGERVKLLDFGIAKLRDDNLTKSGAILGTPTYMAPEQFRSASDVDGQADVYALGVITYQILSGRLPFQQAGTYELMAAKCFDFPIPLEQYAPTLPARVQAFVMRMLARDPAERPTMTQAEAEGRLLLGLPIPRQSGWHQAVATGTQAAVAVAASKGAASDLPSITADMPSQVVAAVQAAEGATPSEQRAVGELSPPGLAVPKSLSEMPSVPVASLPVRAAAKNGAELRAPRPLAAAVLASPTSPTQPDKPRRASAYFLASVLAVLAVASVAFALLPRLERTPHSSPVAGTTPPAPTPALASAEATPPIVSPAAKPAEPAASATSVGTLAEHPMPSPQRATASSKSSARTCQPQELTPACVITPAISHEQRKQLHDAFKQSGAKLCAGESVVISGLPNAPEILTAPAWLPENLHPVLVLALRGILRGKTFPPKVKILCKSH